MSDEHDTAGEGAAPVPFSDIDDLGVVHFQELLKGAQGKHAIKVDARGASYLPGITSDFRAGRDFLLITGGSQTTAVPYSAISAVTFHPHGEENNVPPKTRSRG
jgi:hypothetical protein